ncbi:MAG: hypothetical protein DI636_02380 [Pelagerythrobacter marensis]|nr:MAG: hypothetical protein DI636_02380 [Pelagerythrobacter marensis]
MVRHSFTAREGQTITIERAGDSPMPYFNLMPPGGQPGDQLVRGAAKDEGRTLPYALEVTVQ